MIINPADAKLCLGQVDPADTEFQLSVFPEPLGNESLIEYHAFRNIDINKAMVCRWKLKFVDNLTRPSHLHIGSYAFMKTSKINDVII